MKASLQDIKNGSVTITPETEDDLWTTYQLISKQDVVRARTFRKIVIGDAATDRNAKQVRKPVTLSVATEKTEFTGATVKVLGLITDGPEDISRSEHHSLVIEVGTAVTISKQQWPNYLIDKVKEAIERKDVATIICAFDREQAIFALATQAGHKILSKLKGNMPKKTDAKQASSDFFKEITDKLIDYHKRYQTKTVLLASAAFWKEYLVKAVKSSPELEGTKIVTCEVPDIDEKGVNEVLKRPELKQALTESRFAEEMELVDKLLAKIGREEPIAYGLKDVETALNAGAVEIVLVSEGFVAKQRLDDNMDQVEAILNLADQTRTKIAFIGDHEAGKKVEGLGGVAAMLRFAL